MEKKLSRLMDYQRFEASPRLQALIQETEARYASMALSDEDLTLVNAAGEIPVRSKPDVEDI